ncbi:MAG: MOSC N-terminal beta barrel domain-containing protein [Myxococcota bacterium]|nr:MOSC N-terminal beta barrel domain-containing protein [Myxococcota bacterium]
MIEVASLFVYPVKGLRGVARDRVEFDRHGPRYDREWMLVDPEGVFVTQREDTRLALIGTELDEPAGVLRLRVRSSPVLEVPLEAGDRATREVRCWLDTQAALDEGDAAASWFSEQLARPLRLVRVAPAHARPVPAPFSAAPATTRFTDGFPLLVASQASLDLLNSKLDESLPMQRFRPNLVLRGARAHAEDGWKQIRIGGPDGVRLTFGKCCSRCQVTTIDPATAEIAAAGEPLRTLATYRTMEIRNPDGNTERGVFFGANYLHEGSGVVELGAPVEVLD